MDPGTYQSSVPRIHTDTNLDTAAKDYKNSKANQSSFTIDPRNYQSSLPEVSKGTMGSTTGSRAFQRSATIGIDKNTK